jgi:U3 small nucleolar RNA-associated protein 13
MSIYSLQPSPSLKSSLTVKRLRSIKPHSAPVISCDIDATGTLLATGGADNVTKVWDIRGGYVTHTFHGHSGLISALKFFVQKDHTVTKNKSTDLSANAGFRLASGSEDGVIRVWDLQKSKNIATLDSHVSIVRSLDYSASERALVSASRDKTVMLWDTKSWKTRKVIPVLEGVEAVGFLNNDTMLYSAGESGIVRIWDVEDGSEITKEQDAGLDSDMILQVIHFKDQDSLLAVHADQTLIAYSVEPLQLLQKGEKISELTILKRVSGTLDEIIDIAYLLPEKSLIAVASNSENVRVLSVSDDAGEYFGADRAVLKEHSEIVIALDTDWSGHWLVTGSKDNTAKLWKIDPSTDTFECFVTLRGHAESVGAVSLSKAVPASDTPAFKKPLNQPPLFVISGSQDRTIKLWDISSQKDPATARARYTRRAHEKDINSIDIHHSGDIFASASQDRLVKIWSVREGEVQGVLRGHKRGVWSVKFAPKTIPAVANDTGKAEKDLILTASGDKSVKIWSLESFTCLRTFEGHTNSVLRALWLNPRSTGNRDRVVPEVVSSAGDGLVKVWDVTTGELVCTLDNHEDKVWALAHRPDSNTILSGAGDGTVTFWSDSTADTAAAASAAAEKLVEQTQSLENYVHAGQYRSAITLALQLNHPGRLLSLFTSVINSENPELESLTGSKAVDGVLGSLGNEQLVLLLRRIRDWNTNAKTAPIAQRLLWTVVKLYPANDLMSLKSVSGGPAVTKDLFRALIAYTERHYQRIDDLIGESFLVDYTLGEMDETNLAANFKGSISIS